MQKIINLFSIILMICSILELILSGIFMKSKIKNELYFKIRNIILCYIFLYSVVIAGCIVYDIFNMLIFRLFSICSIGLQMLLHEAVFETNILKVRLRYFFLSILCSISCIVVNILMLSV